MPKLGQSAGEYVMGPSIVSRAAGAVLILWLCAGAAWAGDGADLGSLQALLSGTGGLCQIFNMNPCPQVPTITQGVLQVAGLGNNLAEMVRAQNNIPPGSSVNAGNPAAVPPPTPGSLTPLPLNSTTSPTVSELLSNLTPLAFSSQISGAAKATQLYDTSADTFLYAVGVSTFGFVAATGLPVPDMVYFFYEDLFRTNQNFPTGQIVAKFSFSLTVLNTNGTERPVPVTLQFRVPSAGQRSCSSSSVVGDFNGSGTPQTVTPPTAIGVDCAVVFSASRTSTQTHAIFEVAVPLLVTGACSPTACPPAPSTDPAYFYSFHNPGSANPVNAGVYTAFLVDDANRIFLNGNSIGLAPTAGPLGPPPAVGVSAPFALCATLPDNTNGSGAKLRPAVGAYYAIATSGETLLSAPLPSVSTSVCPPL